MLDQATRFFDHHLGDLYVTRGRLVEGRGDHLSLHRALHVGHFLGTFVDEQHDEHRVGVIFGYAVGDVLQHHCFAGTRRGHDERALALAYGNEKVDDPRNELFRIVRQHQLLVGIERRQVVEEDLVFRGLGRLEVDGLHLDQSKVTFAAFGRPYLARNAVAGTQIKASNLRGRDVDVVGAGQVVVLGGAQEPETLGQGLEHALGKDQAAFFRLPLEHLEDQFLLAHPR